MLTIVLQSLDATPNTSFGTDDFAHCSSSSLKALENNGILEPGAYAKSVTCDECDEGCLKDVHFAGSAEDGTLRAFIQCTERDDIGRVRVPLERLRTWTLDPDGLAQ